MVDLTIKDDLVTFKGHDYYYDGFEKIDSESIEFRLEEFTIKIFYNDVTINGRAFSSLKELTDWIENNI